MKIEKRSSGELVAVTGASQTGKSTWVAKRVDATRRLLVWDYKGEWYLRHRCRRLHSFDELGAAARSTAFCERVAFFTTGMDGAAFDLFCRFAWIWITQAPGTLIIEETASVTSPGKAPSAWGDLCRMGLGRGANIYAITQRPAESDKTALGNASLVHCHRMNTEDDIRYMSKLLRVDFARVDSLLDYQWIERNKSGEQRFGGPGVAQKTVRASRKNKSNAGERRSGVVDSRR
jgi:hypothetical protein